MKTLWLKHLNLVQVTAIAAAVTFNNWVLALSLNRRLLLHGGSISELSVTAQPHAHIFQGLDVFSGVLFALLAVLIWRQMKNKSRSLSIILWSTLIFGIANIVDAILTLPCAETFDRSCYVPIHINWSHFNFPSHGYSSVVIGILYFTLPLTGLFYARFIKNLRFYLASFYTLLIAILSLISATWQYLNLHSFTVNASGWAQGIQMIVMATWFIYFMSAVKVKLD